MMFNQRVILRSCRGIALLLAMGLLAVSGLQTAQAQAPNTELVTFAVEFNWGDLPDVDNDGIPELPSLSAENFHGIRFGGTPEAATTVRFRNSSPPCGSYDIAGEVLTSDMAAQMIHRGQPYAALIYPMDIQKPAYHSVLLSDDIIDAHACWVSEDSYGQLYVHDGFDGYTDRAFAIVTAWVRVAK